MNDKCFMAGTLAALASALIMANSIDHTSDPPLIPNSVRSASMSAPPPANAEANLCAVRCPGYTESAGATTLAEAQAMAVSQRAAATYWIGQKSTKSRGPATNSAASAQPKQSQPSTTVTVKQSTTTKANGTTTTSTTTTTKRMG